MKIKELIKPDRLFLFLFLALFPFGQIIRVGIIQPLDVVVGLAAIYSVIKKQPRPEVFRFYSNFLFIAGFSWIFNIFIFKQVSVIYGSLYLFRLIAYGYFLVYVWNFVNNNERRALLRLSLLSVSLVSALFGWIQFFIFPDIKPLFIWGWDMHLYRLVGTFFDPTYLGLIIVFGLFISMSQFFETKKKNYLLLIIFLLISLAFTYSRASFVAFIVGALIMAINKKLIKQVFLLLVLLASLVFVLPTEKNRSIEFFRSFSAIARVENYKSTIKIFKTSPVFGIGYDNLCVAYRKYIGYQKFSSHACSGSDSSLLFVLATTGVAGLMVLINSIFRIKNILKRNSYYVILITSFSALLIHSLFSNSMFYPWIMGWLVVLLVLTV